MNDNGIIRNDIKGEKNGETKEEIKKSVREDLEEKRITELRQIKNVYKGTDPKRQ